VGTFIVGEIEGNDAVGVPYFEPLMGSRDV